MIGAILAIFTAAALQGKEPPQLMGAYETLEACQLEAAKAEYVEEARKHGVVLLCLQLKTNV